ncbi:MAG: MurR/RpiR family transcriptional regulator [Oscillospiraceae bacterium]|nr:MurR/RpiR family transcriptional regulator [Oscillospiraceae bacterium]
MNLLLKMKRVKDLSPSERQVVNYILTDPERAANLGIVEIAQKTYTSTSTVMRLCKKLDLDGYLDFRLALAADLSEYIDTTLLFQKPEPLDQNDTMSDIVDKVTASNVNAVLDVRKFNTLETFSRVVDMMSEAVQMDFYGSGVSNLICHDAMIKALRMGLRATAFGYYSEVAMLAKACPENHLAFLLSYTGQTEDTLRVAEYLRAGNVPSVSVTSHTDNALTDLCTVNLFVDSVETAYRVGGMSSRLSMLHLMDILFSGFINKNYDRLQSVIEKTFITETFHRLGQSLEE